MQRSAVILAGEDYGGSMILAEKLGGCGNSGLSKNRTERVMVSEIEITVKAPTRERFECYRAS